MIAEFFRFNWLLKIDKRNPLMILLLIHPIYVIWMYKIGQQGEIKLGTKVNKLFAVTNLILFLSIILVLFQITLIRPDSHLMRLIDNNDTLFMGLLIGLLMFCWIYSSYYAMRITIKLDKQKDEDYYPSITDKTVRFFQVLYWIFGIWILQPRLNEYFSDVK
jgi:hypothetical protein